MCDDGPGHSLGVASAAVATVLNGVSGVQRGIQLSKKDDVVGEGGLECTIFERHRHPDVALIDGSATSQTRRDRLAVVRLGSIAVPKLCVT